MYRVLFLTVVLPAMVLAAMTQGSPLPHPRKTLPYSDFSGNPAGRTYPGTVVAVETTYDPPLLTIELKGGVRPYNRVVFSVPKACAVLLGGKKVKPEDLKPGYHVVVQTALHAPFTRDIPRSAKRILADKRDDRERNPTGGELIGPPKEESKDKRSPGE